MEDHVRVSTVTGNIDFIDPNDGRNWRRSASKIVLLLFVFFLLGTYVVFS